MAEGMIVEGQQILTTLEITLIARLKEQDESLKKAQQERDDLKVQVSSLIVQIAELERMVTDRRAPNA